MFYGRSFLVLWCALSLIFTSCKSRDRSLDSQFESTKQSQKLNTQADAEELRNSLQTVETVYIFENSKTGLSLTEEAGEPLLTVSTVLAAAAVAGFGGAIAIKYFGTPAKPKQDLPTSGSAQSHIPLPDSPRKIPEGQIKEILNSDVVIGYQVDKKLLFGSDAEGQVAVKKITNEIDLQYPWDYSDMLVAFKDSELPPFISKSDLQSPSMFKKQIKGQEVQVTVLKTEGAISIVKIHREVKSAEEAYEIAIKAEKEMLVPAISVENAEKFAKFNQVRRDFLKKAGDLGHGGAARKYAYYMRNNLPVDYKVYTEYLKKSADLGNQKSKLDIARYKYEGRQEYEIAQNRQQAINEFRQLQNSPDNEIQRRLQYYLTAKKIDIDPSSGKKYVAFSEEVTDFVSGEKRDLVDDKKSKPSAGGKLDGWESRYDEDFRKNWNKNQQAIYVYRLMKEYIGVERMKGMGEEDAYSELSKVLNNDEVQKIKSWNVDFAGSPWW